MADSRSQSFFILGLGGPESFRSNTDNGIGTQNMQARAQRFWRKFSDFQQQANSAPLFFGKGEGFASQALKLAINPTLPSPWPRENRRTAHRHSARSREEYAFLVFPRPADNVPCEQDGDRGAGPGGFADQRGVRSFFGEQRQGVH